MFEKAMYSCIVHTCMWGQSRACVLIILSIAGADPGMGGRGGKQTSVCEQS